MRGIGHYCLGLAAGAMCLLLGGAPAFGAEFYVYQLPDGSRMVTDQKQLERGYRLVQASRRVDGMGRIAAGRSGASPADRHHYEALIETVARRYGVKPALVKAVVHAESDFDPNATSRAGASGLMQLMPQTAERYGVDDLYDPAQNLEAGVRHLRYLLNKYPSHVQNALAAYNAGEQAVAAYSGIPPYQETLHYVRKVLDYEARYSAER